jgi:hypothetical protein
VFDWVSHDAMKSGAVHKGFTLENCWAARRLNAKAGTDFHEDFFQIQGGSWDGCLVRGNVMARAKPWWYGAARSAHQGVFFREVGGVIPVSNTVFEQNILCTNNGVIKFVDVQQSNVVARNNTALWVGGASDVTPASIEAATRERNLTCSHWTNDQGAGKDGIVIDVKDMTTPDYAAMSTYFANGVPLQSASGVPKDPPGMLEDLEPKPAGATHWLHAGTQVGAATRSREIFDRAYRDALPTKVLPGDVGWPVAAIWNEVWNANDKVATSFTGTYDADGNNR